MSVHDLESRLIAGRAAGGGGEREGGGVRLFSVLWPLPVLDGEAGTNHSIPGG